MVMKMNKQKFILRLQFESGKDMELCQNMAEIMEDTVFFSEKGKEKIVTQLMQEQSFSLEEAEEFYDIAMQIFRSEMKRRLRHPFGRQK